jgi:hypothetical protein
MVKLISSGPVVEKTIQKIDSRGGQRNSQPKIVQCKVGIDLLQRSTSRASGRGKGGQNGGTQTYGPRTPL